MDGNGILILQSSATALALNGLLELLEFLMGIASRFLAKSIKCFVCPLYNVEGINAACTVRKVFFNALVDPSGTVTGNNLYGCPLLWSKAFQKLGKDLFSVLVACPDNRIGIVVHYDGNVLVTLTIACLIDSDVDKVVQPFTWIRLNVFAGSCDAAGNGLPVDPEVLGYGAAAEILSHPGGSQIKALGESGIVERPWNGSNQNAVLRTSDPLGIRIDVHQDAGKVEGSPGPDNTGSVIDRAMSAADRTAVRLPIFGTHTDCELLYSMCINRKIGALNNCTLDVKDVLQ